jgi:hypothetical protein
MPVPLVTATPPPMRSAASGEAVGAAILRKARRLRKLARRYALNTLAGGPPATRVVFIMGAQRSGTRVPLVALESAPDILTFREGARPFFKAGRLAPDEVLDRLFADCAFPVLVLKPLCDSHRARQLLDRFPDARVLWIFRGYHETITSSSLKWRSGIDAVEQLVAGRLRSDDWRLGGLSPEHLDAARRLYQPGLSLDHANAILWYLRSRLLLDQQLFGCARTLVIKYEDLTAAPAIHFPRVFDFVGQTLQPQYLSGVHRNSSGRRVANVPRFVEDVCNQLYEQIDRGYQSSLTRSTQPC